MVGLLQRDLQNLQKLVLVQIHLARSADPAGPEPQNFAAVAGGGVDFSQIGVCLGKCARLLPLFPFHGLKGILPRLQLAGGQLQHLLHIGIAELADEEQLTFVRERRHRHAAGMLHHLTAGNFSVWQPGLIQPNLDNTPLKFVFTGDLLFSQIHIDRSHLKKFWTVIFSTIIMSVRQ